MRHTNAGEIETPVREFWRGHGNVVLSQVRNGTGLSRAARTADMMVLSTWPSRGLWIDGVEIKVSRSDLKKELECPKKADDMAKYCRCWWLAVPDDLLTSDIVVPEVWGVLAVDDKGKVKIAKQAQANSDRVPMDALLVCSILRNFSDSHTANSEIEAKVRAGVDERLKAIRADKDCKIERFTEAFKAFEEATGVDLLSDRGDPIWDMRGAGEAVKVIMAMRKTPAEALREVANGMRNAGSILDCAITALELQA